MKKNKHHVNRNVDPARFNLNTTSGEIPPRCIMALFGSLRRNLNARIIHLLRHEYGLKMRLGRNQEQDTLLFVAQFPIIKMSSARAFWAQTLRLDPEHGFVVRTRYHGLTYDIPAVELSTDTLWRIEESLTHEHTPF